MKGGTGKKPSPIARPAPIKPPAKKVDLTAEELTANAGPFGKLLPQHVVKIAVYAGPAGLCNLGCASKYLQNQLLNTAVWTRVKDQLPTHPKLGVSIKFDLDSSTVNETNDEAELKEGAVSMNVKEFSREGNRSKLVTFWNDVVSEAQANRVGTLEFTLGGGVAVDVIDESSQNSRLYTGSSVADIPQWFDAVHSLLQGVSPQVLKLASGEVTLTRVEKGGNAVCISSGSDKETFNLSDVVIAFRAAGKAYLPIAQRIVSALKQSSSDDDEKEAVDAIVTLLQQGRISRALKGITEIAESDTIKDSTFQAAFAQKKAEKARSQVQANLEYDNMVEFVKNNLPSDYEETKEQAVRLQEQAVLDEENREKRFQEKRAALIAEREAERAAKKNGGAAAQNNKENKPKKMKVKKVDKDGFVTEQTVIGGGKKKSKAVQPKPTKVKKARKTVGGELLNANPYHATMDADKYEGIEEAQARKAEKKGKSVLSQRQGKSGKNTKKSNNKIREMPKNNSAQKKKDKKAAKRRYQQAQHKAKIESQAVATTDNSTQIYIGGAVAVVALAGIYYFGLL